MPVIHAQGLAKTFRVADKQPGLRGTVNHFFKRRYRDIPAVKGIDLSIEPGEIVGFLGANGAGKTTTLKMLTGLIKPTSGQARVLDHEPFARKTELLRRITLVMGNKQQLIWDLPILDTLRINAAVYGIPDAAAQTRTGELAEMLGLKEELSQPVRKLSLGQRMKCELLAALLHHPKVLFLDEPTLGLDVNAQSAVRAFLKHYNERHGASILLTSHYMADITALCPRVVIIHEGALVYDGTLQGVVEQFAPYRQVQIELDVAIDELTINAPAAGPHPLAAYGEVESAEGREARLLIHRDDLTATITRILADLPVTDLKVSDPPIEEIIGRMFKQATTEPGP